MFKQIIILVNFFYIFHSYVASCQYNVFLNLKNHRNWPANVDESCGVSNENRIIGGSNASLGQYPWLARIGYDSKFNYFYH